MDRGALQQTDGATCITSISTPAVGTFPQVFDRYPYSSSPCHNRINITVTALWVATPFLSTVSVAAVCVAVSTNQWLLTQENIKNENYTGRGDEEYFPKNTISGLWTLCCTNPGKQEFFCSNIEYFPKEEYSPDLKDSTMAIPYTVTKSAAFFILSTFLLFVGELCCFLGHFSRQRRLLTFISGVVFIISGLLMLIGLVMYISIFKAEVGGKLRPVSQLQPAVFTYKYGYSFILYVTGFVSTEISGTCAVFLYIYWHQKEWRKKRCDFKAKFVSPASFLSAEPLDEFYSFCRRHPQYLPSPTKNHPPSDASDNFTPVLHRRFYLDHQSDSNSDNGFSSPICLKHSASCSIFNETLTDYASPPMGHTGEFLTQNCFPQDASTNTLPQWEDIAADDEDDCSSGAYHDHDHDFVPFDFGSPVPPTCDCKDLEKCLCHGFAFENLSKTTSV